MAPPLVRRWPVCLPGATPMLMVQLLQDLIIIGFGRKYKLTDFFNEDDSSDDISDIFPEENEVDLGSSQESGIRKEEQNTRSRGQDERSRGQEEI